MDSVLLVDDDDWTCLALRSDLEHRGIVVRLVRHPGEAAIAVGSSWGVVVADPHATGHASGWVEAVLRVVRAMDGHVPILVVTGYPSGEVEALVAELGPSMLLPKGGAVRETGDAISKELVVPVRPARP